MEFFSMHKSKFLDEVYDWLDGTAHGRKYNTERLSDAIRACDKVLEKEQAVQLSQAARDVYSITKIEKGVAKPKPPSLEVGDELTIEHIIRVSFRKKALIEFFCFQGKRSREFVDEYIEKTFYAVYRLKSEGKRDLEAEEYLLEQFRQPEKIKYFNETNPIKR